MHRPPSWIIATYDKNVMGAAVGEITVLDGFNDFIDEPQQLGIVVKSYGDSGSVQSPGFGKVSFSPTEIALIDEQRAIYFINVNVERPNQHPENSAASISYEEIDRIISGAHVLMRGGSRGLTRMRNFEASVSSSDGKVKLVVFSVSSGSVMASIETSGVSLFFKEITKLSAIADCLAKAKLELDRIRIAA
jgi:hypothetical protein